MDGVDLPASYPKENVVNMTPASTPAPVPYPGHGPVPVPVPVPVLALAPVAPHEKILKGHPKALGTVQIMIGLVTLLFNIVLTIRLVESLVFVYIYNIFASIIYISAGALTVPAANRNSPCLIKASLVLNVISAVAAGVALILLSIYVACIHNEHFPYGIRGFTKYMIVELARGVNAVLLVFCLLQFIISICISAFCCKATCCCQTRVTRGVYYNAVVQYTPGDPEQYRQAGPV